MATNENASGQPGVLEQLISPMDPGEFFRDYWEKKPLYIPAPGGSLAKAQALAFDAAAFKQAAALAIPGSVTASYNDATGKPLCVGIPADQIDFHFQAGMTINLRAAQLTHAPMGALLGTMKRELRFAGEIDAYAFWSPGAAGLGFHFDDNGSFTVQLEGTKRWRHGAAPALPAPPGPALGTGVREFRSVFGWSDVAPPDESQMQETVLHPGDILYMPAGTWHRATAGEGSLAVAIGFNPRPLHGLLAEYLQRLLLPQEGWRRTPLPRVPGVRDPEEAQRAFVVERLAELKELVATLTPEDFAALCEPTGARPGAVASSIEPSDRFVVPVPIKCAHAKDGAGRDCLVVVAGSGTASMMLEALPFLERLAAVGQPFDAAAALRWSGTPDGYTWPEVESALRGLLEHKIIERLN